MTQPFLYCLAAGLLGSIPFALVLGLWKKVDIRALGSGNPGATNLSRALGLRWGVLAFLLDAGKGYLPVAAGRSLLTDPSCWLLLAAGVAAVAGHCFSPFLGFRGGKGVATTAGVLAALEPWLCLILLFIWVGSLALCRNVGVASSIAAVAAGLAAGGRLARSGGTVSGEQAVPILLLVLATLILIRHRKNIAAFLRPPPKEVES